MAAQAIRNSEARHRHAVDQAAETIHLTLAGRGQHGAGAEEQQALEQGMIEDMEQGRGQREGGGGDENRWPAKASVRPRATKMRPMFSIVL